MVRALMCIGLTPFVAMPQFLRGALDLDLGDAGMREAVKKGMSKDDIAITPLAVTRRTFNLKVRLPSASCSLP